MWEPRISAGLAGYHTSNPGKTDYNSGGREDKECWDFGGGKGQSPYGWIVRFVDMPKTWLGLAGAEIPDQFQGTIFLGDGVEPAPNHHRSFRERADERLDNVRLMRDARIAEQNGW